jgi:hypothetical protein
MKRGMEKGTERQAERTLCVPGKKNTSIVGLRGNVFDRIEFKRKNSKKKTTKFVLEL